MCITVELNGERLSSGAQCRNHLSFREGGVFLGSLYTRGLLWDGLWLSWAQMRRKEMGMMDG